MLKVRTLISYLCPKCITTFPYFFSSCHDNEKDSLKSSLICVKCKNGCAPVSKMSCLTCNAQILQNRLETYTHLKKELSNLKAEPCAYTKRALLIRQNGSNNQSEEESTNQVYDELFEQVRTANAYPISDCTKIISNNTCQF